MLNKEVLSVNDLTVHISGRERSFVAVNGLSFSVREGETLGIVGESGCGKSVTSLSIMRLLPKPVNVVRGSVRFEDQDLLDLSEKQMRHIRGNRVSMIFQEPMTSLNPVFTVGHQIAESIMLHQGKSKKQALADAKDLLDLVQVSDAPKRLGNYPHALSGGMRQRVMIAMALACRPKLLIADEPTTALDVTIQAQILGILKDIQHELGTAIVLITHDLGVVAQTCDRVMVMYAGSKVEEGQVGDVLYRPQHPYTQALIHSLPGFMDSEQSGGRLTELPGIVPTRTPQSQGCAFESRCQYRAESCKTQMPLRLTSAAGSDFWCRPDR